MLSHWPSTDSQPIIITREQDRRDRDHRRRSVCACARARVCVCVCVCVCAGKKGPSALISRDRPGVMVAVNLPDLLNRQHWRLVTIIGTISRTSVTRGERDFLADRTDIWQTRSKIRSSLLGDWCGKRNGRRVFADSRDWSRMILTSQSFGD